MILGRLEFSVTFSSYHIGYTTMAVSPEPRLSFQYCGDPQ
jgi:hypothetical protein